MNTRLNYSSDYTGDDSIPVFISFCIEKYAHDYGLTGKQAMEAFSDNGILEYLQEHYETLHTQNPLWIINDIASIIKSNSLA